MGPLVVVPAVVAAVPAVFVAGVNVGKRMAPGRGGAEPTARCSECGNAHDGTSGDKCQLCSNSEGNENPPL